MYSDGTHLIAELKRLYKKLGLRYADVAAKIGVSEVTVKRVMSSRNTSLAMLEKLCAAANLDIFELADSARGVREELPEMSAAQSQAVARDPLMFMTVYMLGRFWSVDKLKAEFDIGELRMLKCLTELDRLGVILLFPHNRVRLIRKMAPDVRNTLSAQRISSLFAKMNLADPANAWVAGAARLSAASFALASQRLAAFERELSNLTERDFELPADQVQWYPFLAAVRPASAEELFDTHSDVARSPASIRLDGLVAHPPTDGADRL